MRALGVDPGSRATGFGVIDAQGTRLHCVASGVLRPTPGALPGRLAEIHRGLLDLIETWTPDTVIFEAVFTARNARSALVLGQARGAVLAASGQTGLPVHEYTPAEVKSAVVGSGRAEKTQVQHMVQILLGLPERPPTDAADALAVALCHLQRRPLARAVAQAQLRQRRVRRVGPPGSLR